jgi:hypothetical protein
MQKVYFSRLMRVYASLCWLNNVYFFHSSLSQVVLNCSLINVNVDWLAACVALREVGAVLVIFLGRWRKICTILQPM